MFATANCRATESCYIRHRGTCSSVGEKNHILVIFSSNPLLVHLLEIRPLILLKTKGLEIIGMLLEKFVQVIRHILCIRIIYFILIELAEG